MLHIFSFLVSISLVCICLADQLDSLDDLEKQIDEATTRGEIAKAEELIDELSTLMGDDSDELVKAMMLYHRAKIDIAQDHYLEARRKLLIAADIFTRVGNQKRLGEVFLDLSTTHFFLSEYPQTFEYDQKAADIFTALDEKELLSSVYNNTGTTLQILGDYDSAISWFQKSLNLLHELDFEENMANVLFNLGSLKATLGDKEEALMYFNDVLEIDLKYGNTTGVGYTRMLLGRTFGELKRYNEAREQLSKAQRLFQSVESPKNDGFAKLTLAKIEIEESHFDEAQNLIDNVLAMAKDYPVLLVDALQLAATNAERQQLYKEGLTYVEQAIKKVQHVNRLPVESALYELKMQILEGLGEFQLALKALKRKNDVDQKILDTQKINSLIQIESQIHSQRQDHKIELLEKEQDLHIEKLHHQNLNRNIIIGTLFFVFTVILFIFGRINQQRINKQLSGQVLARTLELEKKNLQLSHAYKKLESDTVTDALTGLKNRRFLNKVIEADLQLSYRRYLDKLSKPNVNVDDADLIVFIIDIDDFKKVNDKFGHNAGDTVLIEFAQRLREVFRQSDYLVRWGGEEFVAVARFLKRADGDKFAERLLRNIQTRPFEIGDEQSVSLTCSVGFASYPCYSNSKANVSWKCLVFLADAVLYFAKNAGKNTWVGIESLSPDIQFDENTSAKHIQKLISQNQIPVRTQKN